MLCATNGEAASVERFLAAAGIPSLNLLDYVGLPVDAVKVGTIKRAKGLEFKLVMVPWAAASRSGVGAERAVRDMREHYVALTRARDALWIGSC